MTWPAPNPSDAYGRVCAHAPHCRSHFESVQKAYDRRHGIVWRCWICGETEGHTHRCLGPGDTEEALWFGPAVD